MVDVHREDVLVDGLDHREVLLALDLDLDDGVRALVAENAVELEDVEADVDRLVERSVDDGRDAEVTAQATCGALAELGARLCLEHGDVVSHGATPSVLSG